jgi:hypothetical protein
MAGIHPRDTRGGCLFGPRAKPMEGVDVEQGISKAGNVRSRTTMIQLAWLWVRHQPGSALSRWFHERVDDKRGKMPGIGSGLSNSGRDSSLAVHSNSARTMQLGVAVGLGAVLSLLRLPHLWPRPLMRRSRRHANLQSLRLLPHLHQRQLRPRPQCAELDRRDWCRRTRLGARRMRPARNCGTST